jgi:hypothetical protein
MKHGEYGKKKVLFLGIDPKLIDVNFATTTGWDANRVKAVAQEANNKLRNWDMRRKTVSLTLERLLKVLFQTRLHEKASSAS